MYKILKRYTTTVFKQALRDTFYDELKFFAQECYYKNMTGQSTVEANTTNEELLFGFTEALQALETTLNE